MSVVAGFTRNVLVAQVADTTDIVIDLTLESVAVPIIIEDHLVLKKIS
jgi:hypothetical protein